MAAPLTTDPSSKHMIGFNYNRKSYVTANLSGSGHGENIVESDLNSQGDLLHQDDQIMTGLNYESMQGASFCN